MKKKSVIILVGSLICWAFGLLLHNLFECVNETWRFLEIIITAAIVPFALGFFVSLMIRSNKGWIYGSISYLIYFLWIFIFSWGIEFQFKEFASHLSVMVKAYVVLGTISLFFAAFGGFIGDIRGRRLL